MRRSEFQRAMAEEFGAVYSGVLMRDHWVTALNATPTEALDRGVAPREVWASLCAEFDVPPNRRYGRGLLDPEQPSD